MPLSTVQRGRRFRELVALVLRDEGVEAAQARPDRRPLSDALSGDGDITGVDGWIILTRAESSPRLADGLSEAKSLADESGGTQAAVVFYRPHASPEEAYAVMTLATLASVIGNGEGRV